MRGDLSLWQALRQLVLLLSLRYRLVACLLNLLVIVGCCLGALLEGEEGVWWDAPILRE